VLQSGTLIAAGELRSLLDADAAGLVVVTPDVDLALATLRAAGASAYRDDGGDRAGAPGEGEPAIIVAEGPPAPEVVALLVRAGVAVHEARRRRPRLEELFARLTEGAP
jgi:ABC-2 type transport system ATP-binding protein